MKAQQNLSLVLAVRCKEEGTEQESSNFWREKIKMQLLRKVQLLLRKELQALTLIFKIAETIQKFNKIPKLNPQNLSLLSTITKQTTQKLKL